VLLIVTKTKTLHVLGLASWCVCECELQETPLGFETRRIRYMALGCSGEVWIHFALL